MTVRSTQIGAEVWYTPPSKARSTQLGVEVWYITNNADARSTQAGAEALQREYVTDDSLNQELILTAPTAFPLPSAGGPQYSLFYQHPAEFAILQNQFLTKGHHYRSRTTEKIVRWTIRYNFFLTDAALAQIEDHWHSARGQYFGFELADPRAGVVYTNVRYAQEGLKSVAHQKRFSPKREVNLIWRSAQGAIIAPSEEDTWNTNTWNSELFGA